MGAFLSGLSVKGQTASDPCSFAAGSQYTVNASCSYQAFDKPGSFVPNVTATGCTGSGNDDAFGWFQATATTTAVAYNTTNFGTNPIIHLYTGTCAALLAAGCMNATGAVPFFGQATETITLTTVVGQNYLVRIQNQGSNTGMSGRLCVWSPPPPPINDNCSGAIALPVFDACFNQVFTNAGATASGTSPAPVCSSTPSTDVWFSFVAPGSGAVRIITEVGTLADGALQLYAGTCGSLTLVPGGCDDDSGVAPNDNMPYEDRRCQALTPGATYFIRFWGYNGAIGTFGICVSGPDIFTTPQQDCAGGFTVCNSGAISNVSDNSGCVQDLTNANHGCLGTITYTEHQGTWYYFSPQVAGSYGFSLQPVNAMGNPANVDYDFAVWGPMTAIVCPPATAPLRCSYALPNQNGGNYTTGMAVGNLDTGEPASGPGVNGFTSPINVAAGNVGQVYVMFLDNFTNGGQAFVLNWTLPNPTALDCSLLPVELLSFNARQIAHHVDLTWQAQAIGASERFVVEHSLNAVDFHALGALAADDASAGTTDYWWEHKDPAAGTNYYRLRMEDTDGGHTFSDVVPVEFKSAMHLLTPRPNPANNAIHLDIPLEAAGVFEVRLTDASGRAVRSLLGNTGNGRNTIDMTLDGLDAGSYIVQVWNNTGVTLGTGRFIKE